MKVLTVVGNRPQFVKAAPLSIALREAGIEEVALHSGQHYDRTLSEIFYEELGIGEPAYALDLRSSDPARMRTAIRDVVALEDPDWTVVFGDTNTTLAGALAATDCSTALAHIEAGLRSGDLGMPEERNRIEVDACSDLLLCPDEQSRSTLISEGVPGTIEVVGDVMADSTRLFGPIARANVVPLHAPGTYAVATVHREANVVQPRLGRIVEGLNRLDEPIVFPLHPRTRLALAQAGLRLGPHVEPVEPIGYLEMTSLVMHARVLLTDSGGLQKEAYWHGVPCVTLRPSTEWMDTVHVGANVLVDDDPEAIAGAAVAAHMPIDRPTLYGDGHASELVAGALLCTIARR